MPSSRVRVLNLIPELESQGFNCVVKKYPSRFSDKLKIYSLAKTFDIVFLQKRILTALDTYFLRKSSKFLVYDFDDAVYCKQDATHIDSKNSRHRKFKSIAKQADLIIAGNSILADYASNFNRNISIVPSAVFVKQVPQKDYAICDDTVTIGWVGGKVNLPYLSLLAPVLARLSEKYPLKLSIICDESLEMKNVEVDFIPWDINTQDKEIARFDIGLMPLADSIHARGKCGYKALQYMAAGVVPVVSNVGVNKDIVEHGKLGLVADSIEDFEKVLETLIVDPEKRRNMGQAARTVVEQQYSVEAVAKLLASELAKLSGR